MKKLQKYLSILLVGYIVVTVGFILFQNQQNFLTFTYWQQFPELKKVFYGSQYKSKKHTGFIPDETAYSYVGGALIRGENPVFNIPEAPPLGKYLIGLSAVLFNNPNIFVVLLAGIAGLIMLYLLSRQILGPSFVSLLPVAILVSEPIYWRQYTFVPLFDLAQLCFLVTVFYFFNKGLKKKTLLYFALANLFLGFFISTKFYASGAPIVASLFIVLLLNKYWRKLFDLFMTLWIPVVVLLSTYLRVFAFGVSPREFLGIQKWIFIYWQGALVLPFAVWDLLFFNRWHTWWDDRAILSDPQWHIGWPITAIISFVTIVLYLLNKIPKKKEIEILMAFVVCYGAFLSVGTPVARYFLIYVPFFYIITFYALQQLFIHLHKRKKTHKVTEKVKA